MKAMKLRVLTVATLVGALGLNTANAVTSDGAVVYGADAIATGSVGYFDINVTKQDAVKISGLTALSYTAGTAGAAVVMTDTDKVCYYATTTSYTITMDSTNGLSVVSGANSMAYALDWTDAAGTALASWGGANLADGATSASLTSANTTDENCTGGNNANIKVTIPQATFNAAPAGTYTDTVTITLKGV